MNLKKFEVGLLTKDAYKKKVIESIGRMNLSLSALFSSMIGPDEQNQSDNLKVFFYKDRHDFEKNTFANERPAAAESINSLLKLCTKDEDEIDFNGYLNQKNNAQRITFQYKSLIIHNKKESNGEEKKPNICSIFPNKCKLKKEKFKDELFIPPLALKGKFNGVFSEINKHSPGNKSIESIELYCSKNNGTTNESLFFLVIKICSKSFNPTWLTAKNKNNSSPHPLKNDEEREKLLSLCDYIMIVPKNSVYYMCPLYTLQSKISSDWKKISLNYTEVKLRVERSVKFRMSNSKIEIATNGDKQAIDFDANGIKPIFHIFVFDNYKKRAAEIPSRGGQSA